MANPRACKFNRILLALNAMQLYYDYDIGSGTPFYGIGFYIQNINGTVTFALREFTPTLVAIGSYSILRRIFQYLANRIRMQTLKI